MAQLTIPKSIYDAMIQHLLTEYPLEACGIVAGKNGRLHHHYPIHNILQSPVAYKMDPHQQIQTMLKIEDQGWELTAVYHSHPKGAAYPSETDVAQAYYPDTIQLIVSLQDVKNPQMRGYTIINGGITAVSLQIK
ncbi:MAG: M67 family metallopeptidase [Chloroflexota bacterium]